MLASHSVKAQSLQNQRPSRNEKQLDGDERQADISFVLNIKLSM
jgi:hypothetical protein